MILDFLVILSTIFNLTENQSTACWLLQAEHWLFSFYILFFNFDLHWNLFTFVQNITALDNGYICYLWCIAHYEIKKKSLSTLDCKYLLLLESSWYACRVVSIIWTVYILNWTFLDRIHSLLHSLERLKY